MEEGEVEWGGVEGRGGWLKGRVELSVPFLFASSRRRPRTPVADPLRQTSWSTAFQVGHLPLSIATGIVSG